MESIVIVGASGDRAKFGNKAVRAFRKAGYRVFPVHPHETRIEGLTVYRTLADIGEPVDDVALYVPPSVGIRLLGDVAALKPRRFYVNPGAGDDALFTRARELGLRPLAVCAIRAIGMDPWALDEADARLPGCDPTGPQ